LFES
jgi:hypothetical protein